MENLKSKKFKQLTKDDLNLISGKGLIWPTSGTEPVGKITKNPAGYTYQTMTDWSTGWFDRTKDYGDAYQVDDNGKRRSTGF